MNWKAPLLLLVGIGISNIGAWIYLLALNLMVLTMTGSPLAVAVLYMLIPIATLVTDVWAGSFIDRLNKRTLMIILDVARACLIFCLPFLDSLLWIYLLVLIINMGSTIFESTSLVYMTKLVPKENRQRFNALRNFIQSSGFILGPSIAGLLFVFSTPTMAIFINAIALILSAFVIMLLPNLDRIDKDVVYTRITFAIIKEDWKTVLSFGRKHTYVTWVYLLFGGFGVFLAMIDSLEAAFATTVLLFSESTYGFLVGIAGLGMVTGSLINAWFAKVMKINLLIGLGSIITPIGYLLFAFSNSFLGASIGFFTLTFAMTFAHVGFLTFYQNHVPVSIMGRFTSLVGMIEAGSTVVMIALIGLFAEWIAIRPVYLVSSFIFLLFALYICSVVMNKEKEKFYKEDMSV
ncbi:permease [Alkalihalobacillus alcalophilus ATCC 27647 = CGMCC 1.3604]|uniref:Permease n=1 Tax=Alkalihalobacillus alcalophilus ATCC 27647 = CGMCC 1.3604 TaxID=1218173 RepID=J8TD01_ALKAL|nr:MFS transporter [Alkalihalobacillus alcalophilus]AFV25725.1 unknown transporter [Alkalihalobacillus alcalophilus ATCC 27647 = CGMCC 1.3604]KGA97394.1 permease [Alkalihalobacillus alcalophilus ATCC 27647 = CGMCC 1.3604]MED1561812.1 MFS transporter [Alkalihalobacillus alcalophilus]THG90979.1 permease [Alkalihalobacillus alcalophilus ATCC 27647 = CGMCC 1.3604]